MRRMLCLTRCGDALLRTHSCCPACADRKLSDGPLRASETDQTLEKLYVDVEQACAMVSTRNTAREGANGAASTGVPNGFSSPASRTVRTTKRHVELLEQKTDYSRWRLLDENGRHTWHYLTTDKQIGAWPQSTADKYFLGLPTVRLPCSNQTS